MSKNTNPPKFIQRALLKLCVASLILSAPLITNAANTSGVLGPNVEEGERSAEIRTAFSPGDHPGDEDFWASRVHYHYSFSSKLSGRIIAQFRDRGRFEYDFARAELQYNFRKATGNVWSSAFRFELRTRRGSRPEEFAVYWGNQWDLDNGYQVRGGLVTAVDFNGNTSSKPKIQTRSSVSKKINSDIRLGLEMFNDLGRLGDFGNFNQQSHQIGPIIAGKLANLQYKIRYLAGVSDGSRDHNFSLNITHKF